MLLLLPVIVLLSELVLLSGTRLVVVEVAILSLSVRPRPKPLPLLATRAPRSPVGCLRCLVAGLGAAAAPPAVSDPKDDKICANSVNCSLSERV